MSLIWVWNFEFSYYFWRRFNLRCESRGLASSAFPRSKYSEIFGNLNNISRIFINNIPTRYTLKSIICRYTSTHINIFRIYLNSMWIIIIWLNESTWSSISGNDSWVQVPFPILYIQLFLNRGIWINNPHVIFCNEII